MAGVPERLILPTLSPTTTNQNRSTTDIARIITQAKKADMSLLFSNKTKYGGGTKGIKIEVWREQP